MNGMVDVSNRIDDIHLPISFNTRLEVYRHLKGIDHAAWYAIGSTGNFTLVLWKSNQEEFRLGLDGPEISDVDMITAHGFCIHGLIPDATLNEELSPHH